MDRSNCRLDQSLRWFLALGFGIASVVGVPRALAEELCGGTDYPFPYTDVASVGAAFCPGIMEAYVTGVSKGTTPTTFSPNETVSRVQMTTFVQRSLDQGLARGSRRAGLNQRWTPQNSNSIQTLNLGFSAFCAADGQDIWVTNDGSVIQLQANTGKVVGNWTGASGSDGVALAVGKVFVTGSGSPSSSLYVIDPTQAPGAVTLATSTLGGDAVAIAFDGTYLWTANETGSLSAIEPVPPYHPDTINPGVVSPTGILYDGANIWVTDSGTDTLLKLASTGAILQTVGVGILPVGPAFDGANIWVPNFIDNSITVVQASTGNVVATINADATNMLNGPTTASFDGERVLITNQQGNSLTVFKAADLSFIANVSTGTLLSPGGSCSDGINFWITANDAILRF